MTVQTAHKLTPLEEASPTEERNRKKMDEYIRKIFGDSKSVPGNWVKCCKNPGDPDNFDYPGVSDEDN